MIHDDYRIDYYRNHIQAMIDAVEYEGVDLIGYHAWSAIDIVSASTGEMETKYHTATHLLNAALKITVNPESHQRGSNITSERMRFDFSHGAKMTDEEKQKVEELVNEYIEKDIPVEKMEMNKEDAIALGAEAMFLDKYGDIVTIYKIGDFSIEFCGGPHVSSTGELGKFKLTFYSYKQQT